MNEGGETEGMFGRKRSNFEVGRNIGQELQLTSYCVII
jgi:hypothetical protein